MTRRIVFSTDHNPTYAWFAPLAALMWRRVAGYEPLVIVVGGPDPWLVAQTEAAGAVVHRMCNIRGLSSAATAQFCRLFAYLVPGVAPEDYLLTVDVDAFPLQAACFAPSGARLDALYPNWCVQPHWPSTNAFPIGYLGAQAATWRQLMGTDAASLEAAVIHVYEHDPELQRRKANEGRGQDVLFNYDEAYVTARIRAWGGWPDACHLVPRAGGDLLPDRLDRLAWPAELPADLSHLKDAHLLRPGWTPDNWPRLRALLARFLEAPDLAWVDAYHAAWLQRLEGTP